MTTTPQAALLREAAQNALITLDGIADTNPRDTADFETPAEWIAWAKSRARWAADALRAPIAQEIYAERILRKMLHESDQSQATHQCGTCGHIGIEDPVKGCPKCGFDDMRAINSRDTQEPVQAGELPPLPSSAHWEERIKTLMQQTPLPNSMSVYQAFKQFQNEFEHATVEYARAALSARKPSCQPDQADSDQQADLSIKARKPLTDETFVAACNGCPTPGKCKDTSGCASAGMNVPTYYVRHPDDTYTAADPQPRFNGIGLEVKP